MTSEQSIINLIKKTKWKSFETLYAIIKNKYHNITSKRVRNIINSNMTHNIKTHTEHNSKCYSKIFSNHIHSYQIDILINSPNSYIALINNNTQYAILESLTDRTITSILKALKSIFKKVKIKSLESDEDAVFV
jgi:ribosomal protein S17E